MAASVEMHHTGNGTWIFCSRSAYHSPFTKILKGVRRRVGLLIPESVFQLSSNVAYV